MIVFIMYNLNIINLMMLASIACVVMELGDIHIILISSQIFDYTKRTYILGVLDIIFCLTISWPHLCNVSSLLLSLSGNGKTSSRWES